MNMIGLPTTLPEAIDQTNSEHGRYLLGKVLDEIPRGKSVSLIGLAYKPGTHMIERSFGIDLAKWLIAEGRNVIGWDPMANKEVVKELGTAIHLVDRPEELLLADAALILLPLPELKNVNWDLGSHTTIFDFWRVLEEKDQKKVGKYIPLGNGTLREEETILNDKFAFQLEKLTN